MHMCSDMCYCTRLSLSRCKTYRPHVAFRAQAHTRAAEPSPKQGHGSAPCRPPPLVCAGRQSLCGATNTCWSVSATAYTIVYTYCAQNSSVLSNLTAYHETVSPGRPLGMWPTTRMCVKQILSLLVLLVLHWSCQMLTMAIPRTVTTRGPSAFSKTSFLQHNRVCLDCLQG